MQAVRRFPLFLIPLEPTGWRGSPGLCCGDRRRLPLVICQPRRRKSSRNGGTCRGTNFDQNSVADADFAWSYNVSQSTIPH
jgi:hypothetical protein